MFETLARDASGRVGRLKVKDTKLETPLLLPVINPNSMVVTPREIKQMGFDAVITNSYIIGRSEELKERALAKGIKEVIGFEGVVMTDSGSYQLYQYGDVDVGPEEIVRFQQSIGSDIGVILDIPTPPDVSHRKAAQDLDETLRRAKASLKLKGDMLLAGTVQGSTHLDLREESARRMAELGFDIYPIGGVVPLMEGYRYEELARVILHSKRHIPAHKPVHLFGAGHPMMFSLAVALGCDIFDSAAYFLYARDGRYITESGTQRLDEMRSLPCACPVCSAYDLEELKGGNDRVRLLAIHNLHASLREIRTIKNAIWNGSLWELVEARCRSHPRLLDALRILKEYPLEEHEPLSKRTSFIYTGIESLGRPEVKRHLKRLSRIKVAGAALVLLPYKPKGKRHSNLGSNKEYHLCYVSPVFGVIPSEIEEVYPLMQHLLPENLDESQILMMKKTVKNYSTDFHKVLIHRDLGFLGLEGESLEGINMESDDDVKMMALADYQLGQGAGEALFEGCRAQYARTGRLRHIYSGDMIIATVRAQDGLIIPTLEGARRLLGLSPPKNRVTVEDDEAAQFIKDGKSVFAKFITACDQEIVPGSEVIVVNTRDELIGWGRAMLDAQELLAFKEGVGVKTRGRVE